MILTGQQKKLLQTTLVKAFPTIPSLEQMLLYELGQSLRAIVADGCLQDIIFQLIEKADSQGWLEELIRGACIANPKNRELRAVSEELLSNSYPKTFTSEEINNSQEQILISQPNVSTAKETSEEVQQIYCEEIPKIKPIVIIPLDEISVIGDTASEVGVDYTYLRNLLSQKQFGLADLETVNAMLWIAKREKDGYFEMEDIRNFPFSDLNTINQLWLSSSNGKFGFSVQKQIWIDLRGTLKSYDENSNELAHIVQCFKSKVEWKEDKIKFDLFSDPRTVKGQLPLGVYAKVSKDLDIHTKWRMEIEKELDNNETDLKMQVIGGAKLEILWTLGLGENNKLRDHIYDLANSLGDNTINAREARTSCRRMLRYLGLLSRIEF